MFGPDIVCLWEIWTNMSSRTWLGTGKGVSVSNEGNGKKQILYLCSKTTATKNNLLCSAQSRGGDRFTSPRLASSSSSDTSASSRPSSPAWGLAAGLGGVLPRRHHPVTLWSSGEDLLEAANRARHSSASTHTHTRACAHTHTKKEKHTATSCRLS